MTYFYVLVSNENQIKMSHNFDSCCEHMSKVFSQISQLNKIFAFIKKFIFLFCFFQFVNKKFIFTHLLPTF